MTNSITVLVAEDDIAHRTMLSAMLRQWGYTVCEASDGPEAARLGCDPAHRPDVALLDVRMPGLSGMEVLAQIRGHDSRLPVVMMTAYSEVPAAVEAIRMGAYDYLTKPLDFARLQLTLRNATAQVGLARENEGLAASLAATRRKMALLGTSQPMRKLKELIQAVAPTEAIALVTGESGTGKELAARAVHNASRRAEGPFIAVNCGAFTESLLASELFGHEKGAFTGADKKHAGLFLQASGGSIFLDEIGEMPLGMQVKLLRVIQEREVLSVGGNKPVPIDCRILAATNRDLAEEVAQGRFREDLYYRLNVVSLPMPPLRDRGEDIPMLANHFAQRFAVVNNRVFGGISSEAMARLQTYHWPGNVRELENVMERAIILMNGDHIGVRDLPEKICAESSGDTRQQPSDKPVHAQKSQDSATGEQEDLLEGLPTLEEVERSVILRTLEKVGQNKTEAAKILGITRKTLHARLNRYKENGQAARKGSNP